MKPVRAHERPLRCFASAAWIGGGLALFLLAGTLPSCALNPEYRAWRDLPAPNARNQARSDAFVDARYAYLARFPDGAHASQVKRDLLDHAARASCCARYERFLDAFPEGEDAEQAKNEMLEKLASSSGSRLQKARALLGFIGAYPDSTQAESARIHLESHLARSLAEIASEPWTGHACNDLPYRAINFKESEQLLRETFPHSPHLEEVETWRTQVVERSYACVVRNQAAGVSPSTQDLRQFLHYWGDAGHPQVERARELLTEAERPKVFHVLPPPRECPECSVYVDGTWRCVPRARQAEFPGAPAVCR